MAKAAKAAVAAFVPRTVFEVSPSIVRTYFLGHHTAALTSMRKLLYNIGLIIECRDARIPLTSKNPLLESTLAGWDRIIVYTKSSLCLPVVSTKWVMRQQSLHSKWSKYREDVGGARTWVMFTDEGNQRSIKRLLDLLKERAEEHDSLIGLRALVVGMPNAGKSTLVNTLRREGMGLRKAAWTGPHPGITRKLGNPVRIVGSPTDSVSPYSMDVGEGVFVIDTPGVFVPNVKDATSMLKLCLVGCVKDGVVPAETLADYLLFRLNKHNPRVYADFCAPTNSVDEFLDAIAVRTGKLLKGGIPARKQAADWVLQQWRQGLLGRFAIDDNSLEALRAHKQKLREEIRREEPALSMNQARKREKADRKARNKLKRDMLISVFNKSHMVRRVGSGPWRD